MLEKNDSELEKQCLEILTKWIDENSHINANPNPKNLLYFLRSCKHDIERTKTKIKKFYLMRAERTEWFDERDPMLPTLQELLEVGVFFPLKKKDEQNRQVYVVRVAAHDPRKYRQNDVFKIGKMILDLSMKLDENISKTGLVAVFDMKNVTLSHALALPIPLIKRAVECWQSYPCMIKQLEFVNAPIHVNVVLNTFRMFMSPKMKSRVVVRHSSSCLGEILPKELGGSDRTYCELAKEWKELLERNIEFFKDDEKYKSQIINNS